jgi:hypothetical protein
VALYGLTLKLPSTAAAAAAAAAAQMDVLFLHQAMQQRGIKPISRSVVDTTADSSTYQTDLPCTRLKPFL